MKIKLVYLVLLTSVLGLSVVSAQVNMPEGLATITPENVSDLMLFDEMPELERPTSLTFSEDVQAVFVQTETPTGGERVSMFRFPNIDPVVTDLPLETGYLNGEGLLYDTQTRVLVTLDRHEDIIFYQTNTAKRVTLPATGLTAYDLSTMGVLAAGFSTLDGTNNLCLIDPFFERFAPDDRVCVPQSAPVRVVQFLADGQTLLSQTERELSLVDANTGEILQTYNIALPTSGTMAVISNPDQDLPTVFISQQDYVLSLNLNDDFQRTYAHGQDSVATRIMPHPNGEQVLFLVRSDAQSVEQVWAVDVETKAVLARLPLYTRDAVGYNPESALAFVNNTLYETVNWQPILEMDTAEHIITFSPNGRLLVTLNTNHWRFGVYGVPRNRINN